MLLYASLGILLLVCFLCATYYRMNRLRRASNKRLHEQQNILRQRNEQLLTMTQELEEATNAKLVFFTNISHDFRTPLTLIAAPIAEALTQLNNRNAKEDDRKETASLERLLYMAQRNVKVLLDLVNQILDFRKVENGKMKLNLQRVDIYRQMRGWYESFSSLAHQQGIHLELAVGEGEWYVNVDIRKVERMVYNLVGNSIKFTPRCGTIKLECIKGEWLTLKVSDTGPGIDQKNLNHIFERFYQIDNDGNEGSGIGLALVKKYAELMGGRVEIESHTAEEKRDTTATGTTITLHIPVSNVESSAASASQHLSPEELSVCSNLPSSYLSSCDSPQDANECPLPSPASDDESESQSPEKEGLPIALVIDDNADMRHFISSLLSGTYRILTAINGEQGLRLAQEQVPDIIICDVMMPVMDGLECCRQLKHSLCTSHIPVVMLTACSLDEQRVQGMECGAEVYLAKPFNSKVLLAQLRTLLENRVRVMTYREQLATSASAPQHEPPTSPPAPASPNELSHYDREFLEKMHRYVEHHYAEATFNVESLADMICLSRTQLYRKCKALTGESPVEVIRCCRMEHARTLLTTGNDSVAIVAQAVGIPDAAYFTKCYKSYFGVIPSKLKT